MSNLRMKEKPYEMLRTTQVTFLMCLVPFGTMVSEKYIEMFNADGGRQH